VTRFLLVEDHEVMRAGVRQVLASGFAGASFEEAGTAAEGLARLESGGADVVVLDLAMPGRGGLELLEEAKRRWPRLPVIVLSAYPEEEFAVRCLQLGASGYVAKSAAARELVSACRSAIVGRKYVTPLLAEHLANLMDGTAARPQHESLSARELQVLRFVAAGLSLKEIAAQLSLGEKTISTYRQRIAAKLGLSTNVELTRYALRHGLAD
jgi:DNA-binding NarL/FixJ family response regulator